VRGLRALKNDDFDIVEAVFPKYEFEKHSQILPVYRHFSPKLKSDGTEFGITRVNSSENPAINQKQIQYLRND
jgi:hypothetical protein